MLNEKSSGDMLFFSRMFYFSVHAFSWLLLFLYDNPFRRMLVEGYYGEPLSFAILVFYSNYLILTIARNPGSAVHTDSHDTVIELHSQDTLLPEDEQKVLKEELPGRQYCEICQRMMNHRSKHCRYCKTCVPKFDHHCFWIGGCVGELNHRWFFMFLFVQNTVHIMLFYYFWTALDYYPYLLPSSDGRIKYSQEYGAYLVLTMVIALLLLFTSGLLLYHSYLLMSGITTWEHSKSHRISYLKIYPRNFHPFDYGILRNIRLAFFHRNITQNWQLPPVPQKPPLNGPKKFNYWSNEYYTCC